MLFVYFTHICSYIMVCFNSCRLSQGLVRLALSQKLAFIAFLNLLAFILLFFVLSHSDFGIANTLGQVISSFILADFLCRKFLCKNRNFLNFLCVFCSIFSKQQLVVFYILSLVQREVMPNFSHKTHKEAIPWLGNNTQPLSHLSNIVANPVPKWLAFLYLIFFYFVLVLLPTSWCEFG